MKWIKTAPATPKSNRFTCPYCGMYCIDICYDENNHTICSYRYCPYCGKEVRKADKTEKTGNKHRPLCLARVFAYEIGVGLACEDCPVKNCEKRKGGAK